MPPKASLSLQRIVLDTADVKRSAAFWSKALGYKVTHKSPEFWVLKHPTDARATRLGLQPTTDEVKPAGSVNALHVELFAADMEREAKRLEKLGALRVPDWPYGMDDPNWIVMRDPDGHEFCIVQR